MISLKKHIYFFYPFILFIIILCSNACNKKCSELQSSVTGKAIGLYDFKDCFIYAQFDSTLKITSDTAFESFQKQHFKFCTASLDPIDFSKNCLLGFKVKAIACNAAFHRNVEIDSVKKIYRYTVTVEKCEGCGTDITSTNIILAPQIPMGYSLQFRTKTQ
jgi:hypothetical protein